MACGGHTNSCPSHPGYDPPLSPVSWTDDPLNTNDEVKATHFNELKLNINVEFTRRGLSPSAGFPPANKDTNDFVYGDDYRVLRDHIIPVSDDSSLGTWSPRPAIVSYGTLAPGQDIQDESTEEMRDEIDTIRGECLCNCNYSCTCDCNYCVCNCNHVCTCNCAYSDERLKEKIVYL